jgi:hypothetical protein
LTEYRTALFAVYVSFGRDSERGRESAGISVGLYNVRPTSLNQTTGKRSYNSTIIARWSTEKGWIEIPGTLIIDRYGTSNGTAEYRIVFEHNYLSDQVRAVGLVLLAIGWAYGVVSVALIHWLRDDPVVRRAQPILMQIICVGSVFMGGAIFTLSWDEGSGWEEKQMNVACMLTPWFFFAGHSIMTSSLFAQDKSIQEEDHSGSILSDVNEIFTPSVFFFTATLLVLVFWTIFDPWTWRRDLINEVPAETFGECRSEHQWAYFGTLIVMLFMAEIATAYLAWRTKEEPRDFQDTGTVKLAC